MSIECIKYKPVGKGTLLGYADFFIPKMGIEITGCGHFGKGNQEWINLPSREYTKPDGEKAYAPIVRFREKSHGTAFAAMCLQVVQSKIAEMSATPQQGAYVPEPQQGELPF